MPNRIEICGNIASGKTTLAKAFNNAGYNCILEDFSKIAYLDDFYKNPAKYAFETEVAFTLQHYYQIKKQEGTSFISDFSLINDYAFALTTLTQEEFSIYEKIFGHLFFNVGAPGKVILLETSVDELQRRIIQRARDNEKSITAKYLNQIYVNIIETLESKFKSVKTIKINTENYVSQNYSKDFLLNLLI